MELETGLTLLIGGARSGKSDLAVKLGRTWPGSVVFVATAEAVDHDMGERIARHRQDRPGHWSTVEEPTFAGSDVDRIDRDSLLIVDCLTLLVSNLMLAEQPTGSHVTTLAEMLAARTGPSIVVSNEVGMGVHPETALGRSYRDRLGTANRLMAQRADTALLIVAGRALRLDPVSW